MDETLKCEHLKERSDCYNDELSLNVHHSEMKSFEDIEQNLSKFQCTILKISPFKRSQSKSTIRLPSVKFHHSNKFFRSAQSQLP